MIAVFVRSVHSCGYSRFTLIIIIRVVFDHTIYSPLLLLLFRFHFFEFKIFDRKKKMHERK